MNKRAAPDHFTLKAKKMGYPARSVFKLEEIQNKWKILRKGQAVLDIGAAPGSWSLYVLRTLGKGARLTAVDLKPLSIQAPQGTSLRFYRGDVFSPEAAAFMKEGGPFGCLLSDAAPSTSGNRLVDTRKSHDLVMRVLDLAEVHLAPGGNLAVKVFQGGDEGEIRERMRGLFETVRTFKPKAVRSESMEIYMAGMNFTGRDRS